MAREKEDYRDILERLIVRFPNREAITLTEASAVLGTDKRVLLNDKRFPAVKVGERRYCISIVRLARWMA